jgi:hypothetical protein
MYAPPMFKPDRAASLAFPRETLPQAFAEETAEVEGDVQ